MKKTLLLTLITSLFSLSLSAGPLHKACTHGTLQEVKEIIRNLTILIDYEYMPSVIKKIVNAKGMDKRTPLHHTARSGQVLIVEYLIKNGADVNAKEKLGWTPLHLAAENGYPTIVELLIANGADVKAKDTFGWTPLHYAASGGYLEIVKYLIKTMQEVVPNKVVQYVNNAEDIVNRTPLHLAAMEGHLNIVEYLVKEVKMINLNIRDNNGRLAQDLALQKDHQDIYNYLITAQKQLIINKL